VRPLKQINRITNDAKIMGALETYVMGIDVSGAMPMHVMAVSRNNCGEGGTKRLMLLVQE
jgi:hypothetical protein